METNNQPKDKAPSGVVFDKDAKINLVVNRPDSQNVTIDLGNVFHNMKTSKRIYAWILLLCMVVGFCVPLVMYQINKSPAKVSSVVRLSYEIDNSKAIEAALKQNKPIDDIPETREVKDLTAPNGDALDLNQITSAYVLQNALNNLELSQPITLSNLRSNINVQRVMTEDSKRQQEIINTMLENKSADVYDKMASTQYKYSNVFVVSLVNGFGDEDDRVKLELKDNELKQLLDQILISYNAYLVETYQDVKLPDDVISVVDIEELDIPESVDQFRTGLNALYSYCNAKTETVENYRSWQTGYSLKDLMNQIQLVQNVNVGYLSAYVFSQGIARDRSTVIDNYRYELMTAQTELAAIQENINAVYTLLETYKNDEILVASPEQENTQSAIANTLYYNNLILEQANNQKAAAEKENEIAEIQTRIAALLVAKDNVDEEELQEAEAELASLSEICQAMNDRIRTHMEEIFGSAFYNTFAEHSEALGTNESFLQAASKSMIIGVVMGALIGLVIWFIGGGLAPEFSRMRKQSEQGNDDDNKKEENNDKEVQA